MSFHDVINCLFEMSFKKLIVHITETAFPAMITALFQSSRLARAPRCIASI